MKHSFPVPIMLSSVARYDSRAPALVNVAVLVLVHALSVNGRFQSLSRIRLGLRRTGSLRTAVLLL